MKPLIKLKTTTLLVIPLVLAGFALLPRAQAETQAQAVTPQLALPGFNTADGFNALDSLTTGTFNSAFGALTLEDNTTGSHNTALGGQALRNNIGGSFNTAVGENALVFNLSGVQNMALGQGALASNTTGSNNTAMGFQALNVNTVSGNTAVGFRAARGNTTGTENTAIGFQASSANTVGDLNVAVGNLALVNSTDAIGANTAVGSIAMVSHVTGQQNTAVGRRALENNTTGSNNVALGWRAGDNNLGASNVICIGAGVAGENVSDRTYIGGISSVAQLANNGTIRPVTVRLADGRLGFSNTNPVDLGFESSRRFKDEITPLDHASEVIYALKPVTFRYKADHDPARIRRSGLIAEEVEKVNPDLVMRDEEGKTAGVFYNSINMMLLNEFLKEHKKVEQQQASIAELKATVALQQKGMEVLTAQLKEQASQIQRVSAQVELNKAAPSKVANK